MSAPNQDFKGSALQAEAVARGETLREEAVTHAREVADALGLPEAPVSPHAPPHVPAPHVPAPPYPYRREEAAPVSEAAAAVEEAVAPVSVEAAPVSEEAAPVSEAAAPVSEAAAPVSEAAAPVSEAAAPVSEAAAVEAAGPTPQPPPHIVGQGSVGPHER